MGDQPSRDDMLAAASLLRREADKAAEAADQPGWRASVRRTILEREASLRRVIGWMEQEAGHNA